MSENWKQWRTREIDVTLPSLVNRIEEIAKTVPSKGQVKAKVARALQVFKDHQKDPIRTKTWLVREQLANACLSVADAFPETGRDDALWAANLAVCVYRDARQEKYKTSLRRAMRVYLSAWIQGASIGISAKAQQAALRSTVERALGEGVPTDIEQDLNEIIFRHYNDSLRTAAEAGDITGIKSLLDENLYMILDLELTPTVRSERDLWIALACEHVPAMHDRLAKLGLATDPVDNIVTVVRSDEFANAVALNDSNLIIDLIRPSVESYQAVLVNRVAHFFDYHEPEREPRPELRSALQRAREQLASDPRGATDLLRQLAQKNPTEISLKEWLAYSLVKSSTPNLAAAKLQLEIIRNQQLADATTTWNLAWIHYRLEGPKAAVAELETLGDAIAYDTETREMFFGIALQIAEEERYHRRLVRLHPSLIDIGSLATVCVLAHDLGDVDAEKAAIQTLTALVSDPDVRLPSAAEVVGPRELQRLYGQLVALGLLQQGIRYFQSRTTSLTGRGYYGNWLALGWLYEASGQIEDAERSLLQVSVLTAESPAPSERKAETFREILEFCRRHGGSKTATEVLELARRGGVSEDFLRYWRSELGIAVVVEPKQIVPAEARLPTDAAAVGPVVSSDQMKEAVAQVARLAAEIQKLGTLSELTGRGELIVRYVDVVRALYGAASATLLDSAAKVVQWLTNLAKGDQAQRAEHAQTVFDQITSFSELARKERNLELRGTAKVLTDLFGRLRSDLATQIGIAPQLSVELIDERLPDNADVARVFSRVTNPNDTPVIDVRLDLVCEDGAWAPDAPSTRQVSQVDSKGSELVEWTLRRHAPSGLLPKTVQVGITFSTKDHKDLRDTFDFNTTPRTYSAIPERYLYGMPITPDRLTNFHGRDDELEQIVSSIHGGSQQKLLFIDGVRRVGKTSLLNVLERRLPADIIYCRLDLEFLQPDHDTSTLSGFLTDVAQAIQTRISATCPDVRSALVDSSAFNAEPVRAFNSFVAHVTTSLGSRKLLLIVDEFQHLIDAAVKAREGRCGVDEAPLDLIRSYAESGRALFIFTASTRYHRLSERLTHGLLGKLKRLEIHFLREDAAARALTVPVAEDDIRFTREALDKIWQYVRGYPMLVQYFGDECLSRLRSERRWIVVPGDVQDIATSARRKPELFLWWFDRKQMDERTDLRVVQALLSAQMELGAAVAELDIRRKLPGLDVKALEESLDRLVDLQVIDRIDAGIGESAKIRFKGLLLEEYLRSEVEIYKRIRPTLGADDASRDQLAAKQAWIVIVDHENIVINHWGSSDRADAAAVREMYRMLMSTVARRFGRVKSCFSCCEWGMSSWRRHIDGIPPQVSMINAVFKHTEGGQGADVSALLSLLDALASPETAGAVIVGGDGVYKHAVWYARVTHGKRAFVVGTNKGTSGELMTAAEGDFAVLDDFLRAGKEDL